MQRARHRRHPADVAARGVDLVDADDADRARLACGVAHADGRAEEHLIGRVVVARAPPGRRLRQGRAAGPGSGCAGRSRAGASCRRCSRRSPSGRRCPPPTRPSRRARAARSPSSRRARLRGARSRRASCSCGCRQAAANRPRGPIVVDFGFFVGERLAHRSPIIGAPHRPLPHPVPTGGASSRPRRGIAQSVGERRRALL